MKASSARDIVFAYAMETAAPHESLPTAEHCRALTAQSLHALGANKGSGRAAYLQFLQDRARRIIDAAQLPADMRAVRQQAPGLSRWLLVAVLLGALALGFAGHAITNPHRVDLLSLSLIGIVLWNLLVYVWLLVCAVRKLFRRSPAQVMPLAPTQSAAAAVTTRWWQPWKPGKRAMSRGTGLRKMALSFEQNWWQLNQRARHAQWIMLMHWGAAMLALGALASLWLTGLTRAYQVGWESTFLSPSAVQVWLNTLFTPVHALMGMAPWTLEQIQSLQGWSAAPDVPAAGQRWVQLYTALLMMLVVVPRAVLALCQGARLWWLNRHVELPLQQPYFQQLQRDWAGRATQLQILPYSLELTPEREAALRRHVAQHYGAGAQLHLLPVQAYGAALPKVDHSAGQQVLLLNMAATPEAEIHGELLSQVLQRWGAQADVWLWAADFRARNTGAPSRVQEREQLWTSFVRSAGLNATLVPEAQA